MPRSDERRNYLKPAWFRNWRDAFNCPICGKHHNFPEGRCNQKFLNHRDAKMQHDYDDTNELGIIYPILESETKRMTKGLEMQEIFEGMLECTDS
jgi:hypothetical protein